MTKFRLALFSFTVFLLASSAIAQTPFTRPDFKYPDIIQEKMDRRISLDLRDIHIVDVLKFLSTKADLNIVASANLTSRVTLFLKDVSISNALEIIVLSTGLAVEVREEILYVMTEEEYVALFGESYRDQRHIKILQIDYTSAQKVGEILGGLKSTIGSIIIDQQTGTVVLIDTPDKIKLMEDTAKKIDIPTVERILPTKTEIFELSYGNALDLQPQIVPLLTEGVGKVQVDERTNRMVVTDFEHAVERIKTLVKAFDRKTRQVFIETKIIQVRLENDFQMGIDWEWLINEGLEKRKVEIDTRGDFLGSTPANFGRLVFGELSEDDLQATVELLHTFGDTKTLATPQIAVENGEEAQILVGTREAFVTSTVSQAEGSTTTSESITFIDVGVQLNVLATINQDDFISLRVTPEVSSVGRTLTTANGNEIPIVDTTNASTKILVKDGRTILIGGLMKDDINKTVTKIPILGELPFFGALFRNTDDDTTKTELVIFLTPHIVEGDERHPFSPGAGGKAFAEFREFSS